VTVIGIVSPGAMGSALARAWAAGGAHVVATVAGRSERTRALARGIELLPTLAEVVSMSELVVSICPPGAAEQVCSDLLEAAATTGSAPVLADLNAVSPTVVDGLAARARAQGLSFVDGSISGGPPVPGGDTLLYLAGERAQWLADLHADGLRRRVVGDRPGTASAVKMCTASVYKGTTLVWLHALRTAYHLGVLDHVLADLGEEFPEEVAAAARRLATAASKSGRFVAEMEQIAMTQGSAGVGAELFTGMATGYARVSGTPLAGLSPEEAKDLDDLAEVLRRLA
jgi:3-hydroxyisobutyrate dehydrogenase-like beta-hydroxyacid dehydrogenase